MLRNQLSTILIVLATLMTAQGSQSMPAAPHGLPSRNLDRDLTARISCGAFSIRPPKNWTLTKTTVGSVTAYQWTLGAPESSPIQLVILPQQSPAASHGKISITNLENYANGVRKGVLTSQPSAKLLKSAKGAMDGRPMLYFDWMSDSVSAIDMCTAAGKNYFTLISQIKTDSGRHDLMMIAGEAMSTFKATGSSPLD